MVPQGGTGHRSGMHTEDDAVETRTTLADRLALLWADIVFLVARVWYGLGAYALLFLGAGLALGIGTAVGLAAVFVVPVLTGALLAALLAAEIVSWFSPATRSWLATRPFRRRIEEVANPLGRGLAALAVWVLLRCRALARRERERIGQRRDDEIPIAYRPLPDGSAATLRVVLADPTTWRDLTYLIVVPPLAVLVCFGVGALWTGAVAGIALPFTTVPDSATWQDPEVWVARGAGVIALLAAPFVTHLAAWLVAAVGAALLSTGESARMRAELDEQRLRRSLAVDAAERERRRIERDLHDGAQQRLVALGMSLGLAREKLPDDPVAGAALVD